MRLSIIIVHYNTPKLLMNCLDSIDTYIYGISKEIIVVDNNSKEYPLPDLSGNNNVKVIRLPKNMGFGFANNVGVRAASGEMVLLLNSDTYLKDNSVRIALDSFYAEKGRFLWGFKLLWPDGSFQNSFSREISFIDYLATYTPISILARYIKRIGHHKYYGEALNAVTIVPIVYAAAMLMWKNDFLALSGFDEKYFMYFEDVDFCNRFRDTIKGEIYYYPHATVIHGVKGSSKRNAGINLKYLKSKYLYGLKRFNFCLMIFYITLDVLLVMLTLGYGSVFNGKVHRNRTTQA